VGVFLNRRLLASVLVPIAVAAAAFAIFRAAGVGGGGSAPGGSAQRAADSAAGTSSFTPLAEYSERTPHVDSQLFLVDVGGVVKGGPSAPLPDQPPEPASAFAKPVREYLRYSVAQLGLMEGEIGALERALGSGDREASEQAWLTAYARYLRLGAVYLEGPVSVLNQRIDGTPGGLTGGTSSPEFSGLHRIEFGLWTGAAPQSLVPWAQRLASDVARLRGIIPRVTISPLDYVTRAHEILEDAVRDLLSGTDVPWSGAGVVGTQAGLLATREVIDTLRPLLHEPKALIADPPPNPRSPAIVDTDLNELQSVLTSLSRANGGRLPTNRQLTQTQSEALDAAVGQALEGLAQVPGMLETTHAPKIPSIPASGVKRDR
jgi:high-affinity iron transporter